MTSAVCPVCGSSFPAAAIERHANECIDGRDAVSPLSSTGSGTKQRGILSFFKSDIVWSEEPLKPSLARVPGHKAVGPFAVDAFSYGVVDGCAGYFLTHFHSDHYGGMSPSSKHSPIYCSPTTAALVRAVYGLECVVLEVDVRYDIEGVVVTLLDANHCPGSVMIAFEFPGGRRVLHTGDFRASEALIAGVSDVVWDTVYLDCTYSGEEYRHASQESVIRECCERVGEVLDPDSLVLVGSYLIGKERLALQLARSLGTQVYAPHKGRILECLSAHWPELHAVLSPSGGARVHLVGMAQDPDEYLEQLRQRAGSSVYSRCLVLRPTGWAREFRSRPIGSRHTLVEVPYSEHSSHDELASFLRRVRCRWVVPTVGHRRGYRYECSSAKHLLRHLTGGAGPGSTSRPR